jgi:hypothetical protein
MDEFFFSVPLDSKKSLCIGSITRREAENLADSMLGDGTGLYLFVAAAAAEHEDIKILAKLGSSELASALANMIRAGKFEFATA